MNKKIYGLVALVLIVGTWAYFNNKNQNTTASQVTIGVIAGTTGDYAVVGENWIKGANVALDEWNMAHPEKQVKLIIEDDGFNAAKGLSAYKKITNLNKVDAIYNMTSPTIDAIYNDVVKQGIPLVQFGEQGIDPKDDNVFQVLEGNVVTEQALGTYAKNKGYKNIAVFVSNNATFERFYKGFADGYDGEHKVYRINPGDTSIKTEVLKALSEKPDAVAILMVPPDGAVVAREVNVLNPNDMPLLLDGSVYTGWSEYEKLLGDTNILNGDPVVMLKQTAVSKTFESAYKTKYNEDLGVGSVWGYDGLTFLLGTMSDDASDHKTWIYNMKTKQVSGATGVIKFDAVGVRLPEFYIGTISGGKLPTQ